MSDEFDTPVVHSDEPPYYCPGCGKRYNYQRECTGRGEAPHPAIDVVSTDELHGDPAHHTPAPASGN